MEKLKLISTPNAKKLERKDLKNVFGGAFGSGESTGGCQAGLGYQCGAIHNTFTPGTDKWDCCACPKSPVSSF